MTSCVVGFYPVEKYVLLTRVLFRFLEPNWIFLTKLKQIQKPTRNFKQIFQVSSKTDHKTFCYLLLKVLQFLELATRRMSRKEIDRLDLYLFSSRVFWKNKSSFETADHAQKFKKYRDSCCPVTFSNAEYKTNTIFYFLVQCQFYSVRYLYSALENVTGQRLEIAGLLWIHLTFLKIYLVNRPNLVNVFRPMRFPGI